MSCKIERIQKQINTMDNTFRELADEKKGKTF